MSRIIEHFTCKVLETSQTDSTPLTNACGITRTEYTQEKSRIIRRSHPRIRSNAVCQKMQNKTTETNALFELESCCTSLIHNIEMTDWLSNVNKILNSDEQKDLKTCTSQWSTISINDSDKIGRIFAWVQVSCIEIQSGWGYFGTPCWNISLAVESGQFANL
jgi:hypothetical protein